MLNVETFCKSLMIFVENLDFMQYALPKGAGDGACHGGNKIIQDKRFSQ